jgi:uncharacterized protein
MTYKNYLYTLAVAAIKIYQRVFFAQRQFVRCKYLPSCSEYMLLALQKYGLYKGSMLGIWRILRCNPFCKGGVDLP